MEVCKWIESNGGSLVIVPEKTVKYWSGINKKDAHLNGQAEETNNFLDPSETDYGKACSVDGYIGLITFLQENIIVLGDEPLPTTISSSRSELLIARIYYCINEDVANTSLFEFDINSINNWDLEAVVMLNSKNYLLFDSATDGNQITDRINDNNVFNVNLTRGKYKIMTGLYEPNNELKFLIHRFIKF
jgi:Immunity protein 21